MRYVGKFEKSSTSISLVTFQEFFETDKLKATMTGDLGPINLPDSVQQFLVYFGGKLYVTIQFKYSSK